jgi:hypothetical protein
MERAAENIQLFQVIEVAGDTLRYQAYTATGARYDAFDLIKQTGEANQFIDHSQTLGPELNRENTMPQHPADN